MSYPIFIRPCEGRISSDYGRRKHPITGEMSGHHGIDIAPRTPGQSVPIRAVADGVVRKRYPDKTFGTYGNCLILTHQTPNGQYETLYAHLRVFSVTQGQRVKQGQIIGYMGTTGGSTGVHLHFEIHKPNWVNTYKYELNPLNYITKEDVVQFGYQGTDVKALQGMLVQVGYNLAIDGSFGQGVYDALVDFQRKSKIMADGLAGPSTLKALGDAIEAKKQNIVQASKPKAPDVAELPKPTIPSIKNPKPNSNQNNNQGVRYLNPSTTELKNQVYYGLLKAVKQDILKSDKWAKDFRAGKLSVDDAVGLLFKIYNEGNK